MSYSYARQRKAEADLIGPVLKQLYDVIWLLEHMNMKYIYLIKYE